MKIEGFDDLRDSAFEELESEVEIRHGYSTVEREGFQAEAECEEDMEEKKCRECIHEALEIAKGDCERSVYGKVFLEQCSVSYEYREHEGERERGEGRHWREREGEEEHHGEEGSPCLTINPC